MSSAKVLAFRDSRKSRARRATLNNPTPGHRRPKGKVKVLDHAGEFLYWADASQVERLLRIKGNAQLGTKRRIRAIRLSGPEPGVDVDRRDTAIGGSSSLGHPHADDTDTNVTGVWSFDPISTHLRPDFTRVLDSVAVEPPKPEEPKSEAPKPLLKLPEQIIPFPKAA